MELNREQIEALRDFCDENEYRLRESYSGRCMYGKNCIGIVSDESGFELAMKMVEAAEDNDAFPIDEMKDASSRQDSMGLSSIIYFPSISIPEEELEEADDY